MCLLRGDKGSKTAEEERKNKEREGGKGRLRLWGWGEIAKEEGGGGGMKNKDIVTGGKGGLWPNDAFAPPPRGLSLNGRREEFRAEYYLHVAGKRR